MNPIADGLLSTGCSMLSSTIVYPANALKVTYQTSPNLTVRQAIGVLTDRAHTKGILSIYRGLGPNLLTYPIFWGVFFPIKNNLTWAPTGHKYADKVLTVGTASSIGSLIANPLFVMQVRSVTGKLTNPLVIAKVEGVSALLRGFPSTVVNNLKLCIQFPLYDYFYDKSNSVLISALGAKTTANSMTYPLDLIRTTQRNSTTSLTMSEIVREIHGKSSWQGLYRGLYVYNAMSVPNFCLMMVILQHARSTLFGLSG